MKLESANRREYLSVGWWQYDYIQEIMHVSLWKRRFRPCFLQQRCEIEEVYKTTSAIYHKSLDYNMLNLETSPFQGIYKLHVYNQNYKNSRESLFNHVEKLLVQWLCFLKA